MLRKRKAQAAMEFLMTYGWAILAAIIVIGAIGYLYLSNIGRGDSAVVGAPFYIDDWRVISGAAGAADVVLELRNTIQESVIVSDIIVSNCETGAAGSLNWAGSATIAPGASDTVTIDCDSAITADSQFQGNIVITYTKGSGILPHESTGSINSNAQ